MSFDVEKIRRDFPILSTKLPSGKSLTYLDNSATSQKPKCVIEAISDFYLNYNSNIHRSAHTLSQRATQKYEDSRQNVLNFFNAPNNFTAVFTRGATESLNIVASAWGGEFLHEGDEILLTQMEHHANIVPWQMIAEKKSAKIQTVKILPNGDLDFDSLKGLLNERTKIVSITQSSNVLGTINDVKKIAKLVRANSKALISVDAAQSSPHFICDVAEMDADFVSISAHKCFGPTGIGVLIAKKEILDSMPPYQGGGDMIENVDWQKTTFRNSPERFEAGTPHISGAIGFGAALDYMRAIDAPAAEIHEQNLLKAATESLKNIAGLKIFGESENKLPLVSFSIDKIHPNDIAVLLNASGIAVRTGHHCAEPLHKTLGVGASCRASFAIYNTLSEVELFIEKLKSAVDILR